MPSSTKRRRALGALAAATVAGTLAVPATGVAGVAALQDDVLTTAPIADIPARVALVAATHAKVARVDVLWSLVAPTQPVAPTDPNDPAYDWTRLDAIFTGLVAANITPIVDVYSTPAWAVSGTDAKETTAYNPDAPRPGAFGQFMQALATRYNGTFIAPGTAVTLPRIRHYEIWNEPNLKGFFRVGKKSSLPAYKALVRAAYPTIHAVNPNAIVIAGVGGPRSTDGDGNVGARTWLNGLVSDKRVKFDAYSQHIYPSRGPLFRSKHYDKAFPTWRSLPDIFAALDKKKKGMKLFITEAGYTTGTTGFRTVKVSKGQQKTFLKQLYALPDVKSTRVAAVVWFNLQDNPDWPGGLLTAAGTPKPAYAAFSSIAKRAIPGALRSTLRR